MTTADTAPSTDQRVREALRATPRRPFVDGEMLRLSVDDRPPSTGAGHAAPPAETVERILTSMNLSPDARLLLIGTGSGYLAAVASRLVRQVFTVEQQPDVALMTRNRLRALGHANVLVRRGNGLDGWIEEAPFDGILAWTASGQVGARLLEQLRVGASLILQERPFHVVQGVLRLQRTADGIFEREHLGRLRLVPRLGDLLVDAGLVERGDVETAAEEARRSGGKIGERLRSDHGVEESDVYKALALQHGLPFATSETLLRLLDRPLAHSVPRAFAEHNRLLPVRRDGANLVVATSDPRSDLGELAQALGATSARAVLVTPTDFRRAWAALDLDGGGPRAQDLETRRAEQPSIDLLGRADTESDAHAVALLDALLLEAVGERASDVHLEIYDGRVRVRLRIDGDLSDCDRFHLDRADLRAVVNVLKVAAGLDITERRAPQGGRFRRKAGNRTFDLRLQTQPSLWGEHAVVRLLPEETRHLDLPDLGFSPSIAFAWQRLIASPSGLALVVGPTGSGKTTTLYAALRLLAEDATRKVITVEDPIEYAIPDIQQTQVDPAAGYVFASAVRSFVRQDPDVLLVGEVRDPETALEATRASQTGHLVLSTLHCNDAPDCIQRLHDLHLHPHSIASELLGVLAQRLGRRTCRSCAEEETPDPALLAEVFGDRPPAHFRPRRGRGCARCGGRGTRGRTAIAELLVMSEPLRDLVSRQPPLSELRRASREAGLRPLRDAALDGVRAGVLPFHEMKRLLTPEQLSADS